MARGQVQSWNGQTGFLVDEADRQRVFFGDRSLRGLAAADIRTGMVLEFDRELGPKGPSAKNVRRPGGAAPPQPGAGAIAEPPAEMVLPRSTQAVIRQVQLSERHPGLQLDRLSIPGNQERQRDALLDVTRTAGDPTLFAELSRRRRDSLRAAGVEPWTQTTAAPLTLHLARSNALENAGLCLQPVYGFAYLPGSGLKGMTRAYAETMWLPEQADRKAAAERIEKVFGNNPGEPEQQRQSAGAIAFHDAWPAAWPKLIVDIVNNHHPRYYQGEDAPGDWDAPNPVYFLAMPAGTTFEFALGKRRADVADALLQQARTWLDGALTRLGAGAKTAAGYGSFASSVPSAGTGPLALVSCEATLELATPAFLAGAGGQKDDCDLRSATVRGLLRWWWRAMHAGFVDVATLRRLEAVVWGDTVDGGAVRVEVFPVGQRTPVLYNKQAEAKKNGLPRPPGDKTTQGLWYLSYGMHDGGKQRHYLPPGTKWKIVLQARDAQFKLLDRDGKPLPASVRRIDKSILLDQAQVALWWLCSVGGAGSKARKGFGSFREPPELAGFEGGRFVSKGKQLRLACGLTGDVFKPEWSDGPALRQMVDLGRQLQPDGSGWMQLTIPTDNVWQAIDAVGMAAQMFAKKYKHQREKSALGLPRRIGNPARGHFQPGQDVRDRHASPLRYHVHQEGNECVLRVAAFPAARLPNLTASAAMLSELLRHVMDTFSTGV